MRDNCKQQDQVHQLCVAAPAFCLCVCTAICLQVQWMEMPGSKIRFTSILHMAFELLTIKLAYQWLHLWRISEETDARGRILPAGKSKAS